MAQDLKLQIMLKAVDKVTRPLRGMIQSTEKLRGQMTQTSAELNKMNGIQRLIDHHQQLQQKLGSTASQMDQVKKAVEEMGRAIAASDQPTQRQIQQFERAKQQLKQLKIAHQQQKLSLQNSTDTLRQASIDTRYLSRAESELNQRINQVNRSINMQAKKLDLIAQKQQAVDNARTHYEKTLQRKANLSFIGMAGYGLGSRILNSATSLILPAIEFEKQMSAVAALARISTDSEDFKKLNAQARELGATTSFTASEAAGGMRFLAMAGFEVNDILATMPSMLNLAKAGTTDLSRTADITSNILSGFSLEASQMSRVSDVLAATFTRANVRLEMLGETMKYVAPIAQKAGASLEEASAMAGLLGNIGIQASMAGTVMRSLYSRLAAPPSAARKALKQLNIETTNATGRLREVPVILAKIAKKTEKLGNAKQLAIFTAIAGQEAGAGLAELIQKSGAGKLQAFVEILHQANGEARRIAQKMDDNVAGDLNLLKSAWVNLNISILETNTGPLRTFIQRLAQLTREIDSWVKDNPKLAGQLLKIGAIVGALVVVLSALALTIAGLLGPFAVLRYIFSFLSIQSLGVIASIQRLGTGFWWLAKTILPFLGRMFLWLGRVFLMNPIGLAMTGIAIAAYLIYRYWEPIKDFFSDIWKAVKAAFDGGILGITALIVNWSPSGLFYKAFANVLGWFGITLPRHFTEFGSMLISGLVNGITSKLATAKEAITSVGESIMNWFKEKLSIQSPSRVFAEMAKQLPGALPTALAVSIAANGALAASKDLDIAPSSIQSAHATFHAESPITIHVHPAPGMNEQQLARLVKDALEQAHPARKNAQLYDPYEEV